MVGESASRGPALVRRSWLCQNILELKLEHFDPLRILADLHEGSNVDGPLGKSDHIVRPVHVNFKFLIFTVLITILLKRRIHVLLSVVNERLL